MHEANLTRFGPVTISTDQATPATYTFRAMAGAAQLLVQADGIDSAQIRINGQDIDDVSGLVDKREAVIPIELARENTLSTSLSGTSTTPSNGKLTLRITQVTQADLGLERQGYFGLNTSDMARQRQFYDLLGFKGEIFPAGPERSTTFARSLGFEDNYLIYVSLHSLQEPAEPPFVDTVQFREESFRDDPPYAHLNHIGMAYATYATADLDGDYAWLSERGVAFVSPPATAPNGERFVFMQDQDGAFLKLIQAADSGPATSHPNLLRLVNTNMNVTDLERSREFYRLLGFSESQPASQSGDGEFAAAHGFDGPIAFEGLDISLGPGTDGATLQLRQWQTPFDDAPPYSPPVNHLGIDRINFYVKDLTASVAAMNDMGFEQLGPIGGSPEIGIVFFFDPDGIKVQIAGPQTS